MIQEPLSILVVLDFDFSFVNSVCQPETGLITLLIPTFLYHQAIMVFQSVSYQIFLNFYEIALASGLLVLDLFQCPTQRVIRLALLCY